MRIGAIVENSIAAGGGFNQALNAVRQMSRLCESRYDFLVFTSEPANIQFFEKLGIEAKLSRPGFSDKWVSIAATGQVTRSIQKKLKVTGRLERDLRASRVDVAYFVTPTGRSLSLQRMNYIATVWDLCHRDSPEFPEVGDNLEFQSREFTYSNVLGRALFVLCDSAELCERVSHRYGVDEDRLVAMPFAPGPFTEQMHSESKEAVLEQYGLREGYFFYPAQIWAHKNHVRILQALKLLNAKGKPLHVVFSGGDKGAMGHVKATASNLGVSDQVRFLGFVPAEHVRGLYEGSKAVVMPSYFGPTNIPPLEAWKLRKPLLYSAHLGDQSGTAALSFDPDSAVDLARAMDNVMNPEVTNRLVQEGTKRLAEIEDDRRLAEEQLLNQLHRYSRRLECWS